MHFWQTRAGAIVGVLLLGCAVAVAIAGLRVHFMTHPTRNLEQAIDFESMNMQVEEVEFAAVDGPRLTGWLFRADGTRPPILLCHDLGSSKASLINLAIELNAKGFPTLLFDFRGHGESGGEGSTLGLREKRDVLAALDYLVERWGSDSRRVGVYGVGMGAHAAVLAAADRQELRVLVLDALYPDPSYLLAGRVFADWDPAVRYLAGLPKGLFVLLSRTRVGDTRAAESLAEMVGRDFLLLAPAGDTRLTREMQRMVESIPDQPDVDGNLAVLPTTQSEGLYGDHLAQYHQRVTDFFDERLAPR